MTDAKEAKVATKPVKKPAVFVKVSNLLPGTHGHNLKVKVVECKETPAPTKGSKAKLAEALIADSTGCILFTARNDQINFFKKDATIIIRNAKVEMFSDHPRLAVDKWGLIEVSSDELKEELNLTNKLSDVEYELVSS
eukprot:TRINITY_DN408_c0_g1_i1.p1 TRINITY_DN408_c0_g1~~TRINITY_DN408_c0_g1_i1.p1  ORF type:complete len:156 (-),score=38.18 TRINITY_DN408_c0_g1_i1:357-770(-)